MRLIPHKPARIPLLSYSFHAERKTRKRFFFGEQKRNSASVNSEQLRRRDGQKTEKGFNWLSHRRQQQAANLLHLFLLHYSPSSTLSRHYRNYYSTKFDCIQVEIIITEHKGELLRVLFMGGSCRQKGHWVTAVAFWCSFRHITSYPYYLFASVK